MALEQLWGVQFCKEGLGLWQPPKLIQSNGIQTLKDVSSLAMLGCSAMGLMKPQDVLKASDDALLTRGTARRFERRNFYAQRIQQFVVVNISLCSVLLASGLISRVRDSGRTLPHLRPCVFPKRRQS